MPKSTPTSPTTTGLACRQTRSVPGGRRRHQHKVAKTTGLVGHAQQDALLTPPPAFAAAELKLLYMEHLLAAPEDRLWFKDLDSRFLLVSSGYVAAFVPGASPEDLVGKTDFDIFSHKHASAAFADEQRIIETGEPMHAKFERETFHDRPDALVSTSKAPLRDAGGNIIGTWGISRDVTAQLAAEQELALSRAQLQASEQQHRLLFEHNPLPVWVYDINTLQIVAASDTAVADYGYSREEFLSLTVKDLRPPEDVAAYMSYLASGKKHLGRKIAQAYRHQYKDGTIIDVEVTGDDLILDGRECRLALCQNVTERNQATAGLMQAREQLRVGEERYRLLFEQNPQPLVAFERTTLEIVAVSNAMVNSYGYSRDEFHAMTIMDLVLPEDVDKLRSYLASHQRGSGPELAGQPSGYLGRRRRKDGSVIDVEVTSENISLDGRDCRLALYQDVTERNKATAELAQAREELRAGAEEHRLLFERNPQPMVAYDCETLEIVAVSDATTASLGYSRQEFLGMTLLDCAPKEDHLSIVDYAQTQQAGERVGLQRARPRRHLCKDGTIIDVEVTSDDLILGGRRCRVCLCQDVTERNQTNAALAAARDEAIAASLRDTVTGLANRMALMDRLAQALIAIERRPGRVALIFIDLDNFKDINDSLGHEAGDRVLTGVGQRLMRASRRGDTVARLGGDEFVVLCTDLASDESLRVTGKRIVQALRTPIKINGRELTMTGSLGAVVTADSQTDPSELLRRADLAMYGAKSAGRDRFQIFDAAVHLGVDATSGLAGELRQAIENSELYVVYQPLFRLDDGSVTGAEALVRWQHPQRGIVSPDEFIPLAEERGLVGQIDAFVLDEACRQLAAWRSEDDTWEDFTISVNVSGRQLSDPGLPARVAATLKTHAIPPAQLCLEITETALTSELGDTNEVVTSLAALGVHLALDDFGTGQSTLAHLQQLHTDMLKIDRSFIDRICEETRDHDIVKAVIAMAHALGMVVVGEGIETDRQLQQLTELGCDKGQGYLFASPLAPAEVAVRRAAARGAEPAPAENCVHPFLIPTAGRPERRSA